MKRWDMASREMCLVCGEPSELGCLCGACLKQVSTGEGLIAEHIYSTVSGVDADAWLVDGFGQAHAVASQRTLIGRKPEWKWAVHVLKSSVGREHAELRRGDERWIAKDNNSRNGTYVDGVKIPNRTALPSRTILRIGDVPMWFLTEVADEPMRPETQDTKDLRDVMINYHLATDDAELRLVGNAEGGSLLQREETGWTDARSLSQLEYQLLRLLCARAIAEADSDESVRGCVPTSQLLRDVDFRSEFADANNVTHLVKRVRTVLGKIGAGNIINAKPGRGYYMNCRVTVAEKR